MSFKRRYFAPHAIRVDEPFNTPVLKPIISNSGSTIMSLVDVSAAEIGRSIPCVEDYSLEKLINANVPLNPVSVDVTGFVSSDDVDSFTEKFLDSSRI